MKIALQLYSLRNIMTTPEDYLAVFPKLKALGYDGVEFAGYKGLSAEILRKALDDAGLVAVGAHIGVGDFAPEKMADTIAFHKTLGMTHIGVGGADHKTKERAAVSCAAMKAASELAAKDGITIYYHNHREEFWPYPDGTLAIDMFLDACVCQIDTYWSFVGGADNAAFLPAHANRIWTYHIKDGTKDGSKGLPLGRGENDLQTVLSCAKAAGLEWIIVEDEQHEPGKEFDDIKIDADFLKANL
ncbi:MAG: sugar phosphate isomerase/epimerase [Oscillospiraceae bacterium]|jgi:sugar phosphate isomerase/epimerase|nr:sugar phosphate isomerase/epimerase [Oscillospiraceae bacterium]